MSEVPVRWADRAMYPSEEMRSSQPSVTLVSMNADPLGDLASMWGMYDGKELPDLASITFTNSALASGPPSSLSSFVVRSRMRIHSRCQEPNPWSTIIRTVSPS